MTIAALDVSQYRLPLDPPLTDATHGAMTVFDLIIVDIRTEDGATGSGYTYTAGRASGAIRSPIEDDFKPLLIGADAGRIETLWQRLWHAVHYVGRGGPVSFAQAAVDVALWDLKARRADLPLWRLLAGGRPAKIPLPMVNVLSGGLHAGRQIEFQDFLAVPHGAATFAEALEAAAAIHRSMGELLASDGRASAGVADEGGWGPRLDSNEQALEYMVRAIESAGYEPGRQVSIAIDAASSHFYRDGAYCLSSEGRKLDSDGMVELFRHWVSRYPIVSIEDGLAEDDWDGWKRACARLGGRCALIGDDLLATNPARLERAVAERAANAVLVKMNQAGTLSETLQVVDRAAEAGFAAVVSARSGETEDSFLADLAVATGAGHIKVGSVTRSERLAKYNRLLRIEAGFDADRPAGLAPVRPLGHHGFKGGVRVNDA